MTSPFDSVKYETLLEGLEASIITLSQLERTTRIDAEFFLKRYLKIDKKLASVKKTSVTNLAMVSDGNHFTITDQFAEEGVPYYRGQDAVGNFFIEQSDPVRIPMSSYNQPHMVRSHLKKGDVLLSIVGTIGEPSLVTEECSATCSCKLAILRPQKINHGYLAIFLSSKYGLSQIQRLTRGAVQQGLILDDMQQLEVVRFSLRLENLISKSVESSHLLISQSRDKLNYAEQILLKDISLNAWQPSEPLGYIRSSQDVFNAGRLDSQFFSPRVFELIIKLSKDGIAIQDVASIRHEKFLPIGKGEFNYIEINNINMDGTTGSKSIPINAAPSRATWHVRQNDVISTTIRPIRRLSALISPEQDGYICSSGFIVLQPKKVDPEVLLTYLRLPIICELMDLHTSASMYPAISEKDLLNLPFPKIEPVSAEAIIAAVRSAQMEKERAMALLDCAKHAVEIAIEQNEESAMELLTKEINCSGH